MALVQAAPVGAMTRGVAVVLSCRLEFMMGRLTMSGHPGYRFKSLPPFAEIEISGVACWPSKATGMVSNKNSVAYFIGPQSGIGGYLSLTQTQFWQAPRP